MKFVYYSHKSLATCATTIIYPTQLVLCYSKHICVYASVYSNLNIVYTQLGKKICTIV